MPYRPVYWPFLAYTAIFRALSATFLAIFGLYGQLYHLYGQFSSALKKLIFTELESVVLSSSNICNYLIIRSLCHSGYGLLGVLYALFQNQHQDCQGQEKRAVSEKRRGTEQVSNQYADRSHTHVDKSHHRRTVRFVLHMMHR